MNPQDQPPSTAPPNQQLTKANPLSTMQSGERIICEIRRHPIGIVGMYVMTGIFLIFLAVIAFGVAPSFITSVDRSQVLAIGTLIFLVFAVLCVGFAFIFHIVYWGNRWIVTDDSVTQIIQTSLFNKQSSQLSLDNLEDVTATQNGILAHMFNYGTLRAETAGEHSKFTFPFCPNPNYYGQQILEAREEFEQELRSGHEAPGEAPESGTP